MSLDWTPIDSYVASMEGWDIFETHLTDEPWQLQKLDCPDDLPDANEFDDDGQAWEVVWARAWAGSPFHRKTLQFIHDNSPHEWRLILEHCLDLT